MVKLSDRLPRIISIVIQRLLFATCLTVTQYIALILESQHFFQRFFDFLSGFWITGVNFYDYKSAFKLVFKHSTFLL